ncbi:MAG: hypothetical protein MI919_20940 [Holophagales bacterium]|nr:hypothetical protein [Holophagales bacterium]
MRLPRSRRHEVLRVALLGGARSGQRALFQAMAYRAGGRRRAGALASLIAPGAGKVERLGEDGRPAADETERLVGDYEGWRCMMDADLDGGPDSEQESPTGRYRLELPYPTGWLGCSPARLHVDLYPPSLLQLPLPPGEQKLLQRARVLIFAVPFWACLPRRDVGEEVVAAGREHLEALGRQIFGVQEARRGGERASIFFALTLADDERGGLPDLREAWIHRTIEGHRRLAKRLRRPRYLLTYLDNARRISEHLHRLLIGAEADASRSAGAAVLELLELEGSERAWLLPVSALDSRIAENVAAGGSAPGEPPIPAHVELPLLLTLCEHAEALR